MPRRTPERRRRPGPRRRRRARWQRPSRPPGQRPRRLPRTMSRRTRGRRVRGRGKREAFSWLQGFQELEACGVLERAGIVRSWGALQGVLAGLAGADAHHLLERRDEDLSVADLSGARRGLDGLDDLVDQRV